MNTSKTHKLVQEIAFLSGKFDLDIKCDGKHIIIVGEGDQREYVSVHNEKDLQACLDSIKAVFADLL